MSFTKLNLFKVLSTLGMILGGAGTLLSSYAQGKEQERVIEEKVEEKLREKDAFRN